MIEVKFSGENASEIQNQMRDFLGDARLHSTSETVATPAPKPRASRAAKSPSPVNEAPAVRETVNAPKAEVAAPTSTGVQTAEVKLPPVPTDEEVQKALVAVNDKFGIDKAIECLNKFGVKRGRELTDVQKAPFVALCKQVLG